MTESKTCNTAAKEAAERAFGLGQSFRELASTTMIEPLGAGGAHLLKGSLKKYEKSLQDAQLICGSCLDLHDDIKVAKTARTELIKSSMKAPTFLAIVDHFDSTLWKIVFDSRNCTIGGR